MAWALAGDPIAGAGLLVGAQLIAHTTLATPHLGIPEKAVQAVLALVAPGVVQTFQAFPGGSITTLGYLEMQESV